MANTEVEGSGPLIAHQLAVHSAARRALQETHSKSVGVKSTAERAALRGCTYTWSVL